MGIGQPNGTILLQDLYSDTPYTEENKENTWTILIIKRM